MTSPVLFRRFCCPNPPYLDDASGHEHIRHNVLCVDFRRFFRQISVHAEDPPPQRRFIEPEQFGVDFEPTWALTSALEPTHFVLTAQGTRPVSDHYANMRSGHMKKFSTHRAMWTMPSPSKECRLMIRCTTWCIQRPRACVSNYDHADNRVDACRCLGLADASPTHSIPRLNP